MALTGALETLNHVISWEVALAGAMGNRTFPDLPGGAPVQEVVTGDGGRIPSREKSPALMHCTVRYELWLLQYEATKVVPWSHGPNSLPKGSKSTVRARGMGAHSCFQNTPRTRF
jgi:hypothetical protein